MSGDHPVPSGLPTLASARPESDLEGRLVLQAMRGAMFGARAKPLSVGRYELRERLGAGALGLVVAAHDPELDRQVAIKLLPASIESRKLLREARALARLSSPNVVAVLDVGTFEPQDLGTLFSGDPGDPTGTGIWLAMELVDGTPLDAWIRQGPHEWAEVLNVFRGAGQGLADAHRARIVHRDFKPANVILGHDERVRVVDFGLARSPNLSFMTAADAAMADDDAALHRGLIGTPAFMSPEQHNGNPTDARADQFSFCVSMYEALYDDLPYPGPRYEEFMRDKMAGPPSMPSEPAVPASIRDALTRGLSTDPADRFESMDDLLVALSPERRSSTQVSGRAVVGGILGIGLLATAALAVSRVGTCKVPEADKVAWEQTKAQVVAAIAAADQPYAKVAAFRVQEVLDTRIAAWSEARNQACDADVLDPATEQCVVQAMRGLDVAMDRVNAMASGKLSLVESVLEVIPDGARCTTSPAPVAQEGNALDAVGLRQRILAARLQSRAGEPGRGQRAAESVSLAAADFGFAPLVAEALFVEGESAWLAGDLDGARSKLEQAHARAIESKYDRLAAKAAAYWVRAAAEGDNLGADAWAAKALQSLGDTGGALAVEVHAAQGHALAEQGKWLDAVVAYEQAQSAAQADPTVSPQWSVRLHGDLADAQRALGRPDDAWAGAQRALSVAESTFGPGHPELVAALARVGRIELAAGHRQEAESHLRRALELCDAGAEILPATLGDLIVTLAKVVSARGGHDEAKGLLERALTLQSAEGPLANTLGELCRVALRQGDVGTARAHCEAALAAQQARDPADEPGRAALEHQLGVVLLAANELAAADETLTGALKRAEKHFGPGHPEAASLLVDLAALRERQDRTSDAVALLDRVAAMSATSGAADHNVVQAVARRAWLVAGTGNASDALASVVTHLAKAGDDLAARDRFALVFAQARIQLLVSDGQASEVESATQLARTARLEYARTDATDAALLAQVDAWLDAHKAP